MKFKIVFFFVCYCLKSWVNPWNFFQIHSNFFDSKKWIFSKLDLEKSIPKRWRLPSVKISSWDTYETFLKNVSFPIVWKPEWWQNAHGVRLLRDSHEFSAFLQNAKNSEIPYLIQEFSNLDYEYELSFTKDQNNLITLWSLVEVENIDQTKINSIHGRSRYIERLWEISQEEREKLQQYLMKLNNFKIARVWIKSSSIKDLISWNFKIFEINIFIPLPLKLLAENISKKEKISFLKAYTKNMVTLTKFRTKSEYKEVFFRKIFLHYKIKFAENKVFRSCKKKLYFWIEKTFMNGCSDYNPIDVRRACRSKKQAREMFEEYDIPHAAGCIFINPLKAYNFVKKYWFPIVLKPNVWWYSRGSYFPITNFKDFWKAMFLVKLRWPSTVIETYLLGKNYRVIVTKDSVDIAMERTPPFVIWDGMKSISELIDEENNIRKNMNLCPIIHTIKKTSAIKKHLKKQSYDFLTILDKWKKVFLYHRVSLAPWWVLFTVDPNTISSKNKEIFKTILREFHANIFWIDVIMEKGIEYDFDKQKTIFLELNSRPYLKMHTVPRSWEIPDMEKLYKKLDDLEISGKWLF